MDQYKITQSCIKFVIGLFRLRFYTEIYLNLTKSFPVYITNNYMQYNYTVYIYIVYTHIYVCIYEYHSFHLNRINITRNVIICMFVWSIPNRCTLHYTIRLILLVLHT